jgi:hypothetical protein
LLAKHAEADVILGYMGSDPLARDSIPNALLISKPRAPFWLSVMRELVRRVNCHTPMFDTGPTMLTDVVRAHADARVTILPSSYFYPLNWGSKGWRRVPRCNRTSFDYAGTRAIS